MKIVCMIMCLLLGSTVWAAQAPADQPKEVKPAEQVAPRETAPEARPNEFSCKYYTVTLPEDWSAVTPPTEQQGNINAIFAANSGASVVTIIIGPNGGADALTIATMFAEQFKAHKTPVDKNGKVTFSFPNQDGNAQAIVGVQGKEFMVITLYGKYQDGKEFLRNNVKSEEFGNLLQ